jgi:hypothetical protein
MPMRFRGDETGVEFDVFEEREDLAEIAGATSRRKFERSANFPLGRRSDRNALRHVAPARRSPRWSTASCWMSSATAAVAGAGDRGHPQGARRASAAGTKRAGATPARGPPTSAATLKPLLKVARRSGADRPLADGPPGGATSCAGSVSTEPVTRPSFI